MELDNVYCSVYIIIEFWVSSWFGSITGRSVGLLLDTFSVFQVGLKMNENDLKDIWFGVVWYGLVLYHMVYVYCLDLLYLPRKLT